VTCPTGSGKTTLLNAILDAIAELTPFDRVISIEDTTELQCRVPNYLDLRAVGNVTMLECLRASMRLKPTRIVVGEVRGAEAHTLLKAWNTGHPGGLGTIHANGALLGLTRLESLVAEGTDAPQQKLIAETVDLVIFVDPEPSLTAQGPRDVVSHWLERGTLPSRTSLKGAHTYDVSQTQTFRLPFRSPIIHPASIPRALLRGARRRQSPWEKPMTLIATSLTSPVAYAIGLIGICIAGGTLLFGHELGEVGRRACMIGLVVAVLIFAAPMLASAFGVGGAVV